VSGPTVTQKVITRASVFRESDGTDRVRIGVYFVVGDEAVLHQGVTLAVDIFESFASVVAQTRTDLTDLRDELANRVAELAAKAAA
jgi:hypothetical protein